MDGRRSGVAPRATASGRLSGCKLVWCAGAAWGILGLIASVRGDSGLIDHVEIDTAFHMGNFPMASRNGSCAEGVS